MNKFITRLTLLFVVITSRALGWPIVHAQTAANGRQGVVLRGLLGGLGMGIIGALLPLTLFSGLFTLVLVQKETAGYRVT